MTVTFLAISFLMGLFVSATRNNNRSKQVSTSGLLAQGKMEMLAATPLDQIVQGTDTFAAPYDKYVYDVQVADAGDYDGDGVPDYDMKMITLTVTPPDNKSGASLMALRSTPEPFIGVACHGSNPDLTFMGSADASYPYVHGWEYATATLDPASLFPFASGTIQPMPNGGRPGDVCATPDLKAMFAVDYVNGGLRYFSNTTPNWSSTLLRPAGLGWATGVAMNLTADTIWISDESNHCLWKYNNVPALAGTWSGAIRPSGSDVLGRLRDISVDDTGNHVWVADVDHNCVRHYKASANAWDPTLYKNPDNSMDHVNGVAITRDNSRLFVMDALTLQWCDVTAPAVWTKIDLMSKLAEDGPQGLTVSDDGKTIWAIAKNGLLFRCDVTDPAYPVWDELGP